MERIYLVKVGEILLKLGNRREFEGRLKAELKRRLEGAAAGVDYYPGRFFIRPLEGMDARIEKILSRTPGVNGFARAIKTDKTPEAVMTASLVVAEEQRSAGLKRFKAEARRSDKSFPLNSYEIARDIGAAVTDKYSDLIVDVHTPDFIINAEIREHAYVYSTSFQGLRGLPTGSQGRGLLLLSGGIDSPVAGYLMASRGLSLDAVYFHAYPYTSEEARQKVISLAKVVSSFCGGMNLYTVPFTDVQMRIKERARLDLTTLMMRAAMMELSQELALKIGANCLITGESLGQVASQTAENLRFTGSLANLPVLRPLIGLDKEATVDMAKKIGSFDISILPYEDCCVIFSPKHPLLKAELERETAEYNALELRPLLEEALSKAETTHIPYTVEL